MSDRLAQTLSAFSSTVLDIQRLAQSQSIEHFHSLMIERLSELITFDKAWWGLAALINGVPVERSTQLFKLPVQYLLDWQSISHDDVTIESVHSHPGHAVVIDMGTTPGLTWLGAKHHIGQLMCIIVSDPITRLSEHLTLYRSPDSASFSPQDGLLLETLMPHLSAAVAANRIRTLIAARETLSNPQNLALAVCDRHGTLHCAEPGFIALLLQGWPKWSGPSLPIAIETGETAIDRIHLSISNAGDLFLIAGRQQNPLETLSPREHEVASSFGEGRTYKEVARDLGLAPNTVRHHIRSIYSKLGVKDKARIGQLLRNNSG
ncbi:MULTISPECIES: helix-turn-helix transcriptional regulator [Pseudomonas]|uniref:helix-turn-helix transcriptional regulator n=1 Tax=Pseudomonas TaxID=286 RepID=UPI00159DC660|nr:MULTISPECIES: helix-turn-helix transcriptional regulator [Pseudomonas]MBP2270878.1 DNA-binding CsgD family transcriptional regulator [Pseudomonas sp. BP6]MBP2290152.1 DNA-binding CsgD family transcriptional regulator [Pseudomonas sp. BP7]NVN64926.1 helix-turn-helix transcriptional regulator [Pseudomonas putida]NVN70050.1 helix-turn-helix transcriptional regulator [Pseudomonas putida]HDS1695706.1 helix-turn-helix transcriptional regulator [Pseudomonas putida]